VRQDVTIAIIDDDQDVRSGLENFLRSAGLGVRTFDRAESFLNSPHRDATDCLVTDINMPGMDGLALHEELNRLGRAFPVIIMTAFPTPEAKERAAKLGATAFLTKPLDPDQLLECIESAFDGRKPRNPG
jgi:FixJ family two-component response regulator